MIECKDVVVQFDKNVILNKFNYIFKDNTITGIVGKSGAGKSTLLRSIAGLQKLTNGSIFLNDKKILKPNKEIMMMHQHYNNFPWKTVRDNLLFSISLNKKIDKQDEYDIDSLLNIIGLYEYKDRYPSELSGGMNQRLALGRSIVLKPKVLLMDEPMSALDIVTRTEMQNLILKFHKKNKNMIIFITHDNNEAKIMSDNIIKF